MIKWRAVFALFAALAVAAASGVVPLQAQGSSPVPPTDLKLVGDHWTAWDPPEPGPGAYIIEKGDTLWDLAETWLGDPYLWPQVWEENRYIEDSHWIYPGDPLVVPGRPTVVPDGGPPVEQGSTESEEPTGEAVTELEPEPQPEPEPAPPPLLPIADASDIYCSGYITPEHESSPVFVAGREEPLQEHLGGGEVIYLSQGKNHGIQAGDEFMVIRPTREVSHPMRPKKKTAHMGTLVRRMGKVRVMLTQAQTSTAVVEMACEDIRDGDELVPWKEIPVPRFSSMPEFERFNVEPSGGAVGYLVATIHELDAIAAGHIVFTDLGVASGVRPGDVLTVYKEQNNLPRINLGQAIILTVEPETSTAKVTYTVREAVSGDLLEVAR